MCYFPRLAFLLSLIFLSSPGPLLAQDSGVKSVQEKIAQWVKTRQLIAEEREEWVQDKAILNEELTLLEQQKASLLEEIEQLESSQVQDDGQREELLNERGELRSARDDLEEALIGMEGGIRKVVDRLPDVLTSERQMTALLTQIPEDSEDTEFTTGNRLVAILGVLTQAERFNDTTRIEEELRAFGEGEDRVRVTTVYWGLAFAFSVDGAGARASFGYPPEEGGEWVFEDVSDSASEIRTLVDIAQGNTDEVRFVKLPITLN